MPSHGSLNPLNAASSIQQPSLSASPTPHLEKLDPLYTLLAPQLITTLITYCVLLVIFVQVVAVLGMLIDFVAGV